MKAKIALAILFAVSFIAALAPVESVADIPYIVIPAQYGAAPIALSGPNQPSQEIELNGQSTYSVTLAGSGFSAVIQVSGDRGATWITAPGSSTMTSAGTQAVGVAGYTRVRLFLTSGSLTYVESASAAVSPATISGSFTGATPIAYPTATSAPFAMQVHNDGSFGNSTPAPCASDGNGVCYSHPTGVPTFAPAPTPIPTLSPNADGGAPVHLNNASITVTGNFPTPPAVQQISGTIATSKASIAAAASASAVKSSAGTLFGVVIVTPGTSSLTITDGPSGIPIAVIPANQPAGFFPLVPAFFSISLYVNSGAGTPAVTLLYS